MTRCLVCAGESKGYSFRALEVQTLHVRDYNGEKRVQALGSFRDWTVCEDCARRRLEETLSPGKRLAKACLPFLLVLAGGIFWMLLVHEEAFALRLLGPAAIFCGLAGTVSSVRRAVVQRAQFLKLPREEALKRAAWSCALSAAPNKNGDNDLTYIPVDEETQGLDWKQMVLRYDLLPPIAAQALERLGAEREE